MTDSVVAEGQVKFRDGNKWKTRWVVLRKPSPVADCLYLLVYKEKKRGKEKGSSHKERLSLTLEGICGVEPGTGYDGVSYTLSILCLAHTVVLGFNSRDALLAWDSQVCFSLGEVHRLSVNVEPGTKLTSGPASLHLCNNLLVLTRGIPPAIIGHWKLSALRRYGAVPSGFVFEGGTRCGIWAGIFFLSCSDGEHISFLFDCIVRGITPSKGLHCLRHVLQGPSADGPELAEKQILQETSELEKRLSMLSNCSLASSTASTYSCSTSAADDQSSISSSSSSQSDASYGSRLPFWMGLSARPHLSETASNSSTAKSLSGSDDQLYAAVIESSRADPSSAHLHPRGLHDSGRQSSLDSGIGISTGSQSYYSGSSSLLTGSLDTAYPGEGEEFGFLKNLQASPPPLLPPPPPPAFSPPGHSSQLSSKNSSTTSLCPCASRSSSCTSCRHTVENQIPSLIGLWYDTPRNLFQAPSLRNTSKEEKLELGRDSRSSVGGGGRQGQKMTNSPKGFKVQHQATIQHLYSWDSERAPSVDSEGKHTPRHQLIPGDLFCRDLQCSHSLENYITPEQWRSGRTKCVTQIDNSPKGQSPSAVTQDPSLYQRQEHIEEAVDKLTVLNGLPPFQPPSSLPPMPLASSMHSPKTAFGVLQSSCEASPSVSLDTELQSNSTVNNINIPVSPLFTETYKEPHYTEWDLQGLGSASDFSAVRVSSQEVCSLEHYCHGNRLKSKDGAGQERQTDSARVKVVNATKLCNP
ncbi:protein Dok-7-like isoform X2 [Cheilinus undulatus]|uniref:protein Dok-7-like isoform X2 n=1 Tax=Cheilinus undulatus TaxID=241271 RepID=UPI001BD4AA4B|nr:protein Dok-7-like isoform X2 [Cheilinus undulatus]